MSFIIRPAEPEDRDALARCIAEGFERDFSILCKDIGKTARALAGGIQTQRFFVAEQAESSAGRPPALWGAAAVSDCRGRAVKTDRAAYLKHFGPLRGRLALLALKPEFEPPLDYPPSVGYLEFVAVGRQFRRRGVATALLQKIVTSGLYADYILDVTDINAAAIQCYEKAGFREFQRVPEKHRKQKGFSAKIYMKYVGA